jgi:hypothetical protein
MRATGAPMRRRTLRMHDRILPQVAERSAQDARRLRFLLEAMEREKLSYRDAQALWEARHAG